MKKGTKEFAEMQNEFEKVIVDVIGKSIERDNTGIRGIWYENGEVNNYFMVFMLGYQTGRVSYIN